MVNVTYLSSTVLTIGNTSEGYNFCYYSIRMILMRVDERAALMKYGTVFHYSVDCVCYKKKLYTTL